ncbi:DUF3141 domain-containing protein [Cupriavidus basilensis]
MTLQNSVFAPGAFWELAQSAMQYGVDAWQRTVLYADVHRQRGDQYREHLRERIPHVLNFPYELVMAGLELPRPVNYGLVRILPLENQPVDLGKRPFVVVDPRAGHGPGIGGFKADSEIGAAMKAGHPCYFIGFVPDPTPGQTVEDVMRAEAAFLRKVAELHPDSPGKPVVIGNCQAGWQILMTAAVWPELFGPIIVAGAPLSYWAGDNPMRYSGGLLGGSWLTALTSDLGAGRFDGAWLVQNFENLNPANTLWSKQYKLYSAIDTEAERYLSFEKYWGGHVFLNDVEMQYIVDDLFIGNKLATAELLTSDGVRIDLRNIRSPIVVFCSYGDNITPPAQALGWITDLYRDDEDIAGHDQTIVFATHDSIGHLGIFVSSSVGRKEHREFAANIDVIDLLPAGIYRAQVEERPAGMPAEELPEGEDYLMSIRRSGVEEVRQIVRPDPASDRRFAAVSRVSEINLALYRNFSQPWVKALSTPHSAHWLQMLHPLRVSYECWSSAHPLASVVANLAEQVREMRQPVEQSNPFLEAQATVSHAVESSLDEFRRRRDQMYADLFGVLYGSPWLAALAGQTAADDVPVRAHPGDSPEHRKFLAQEQRQWQELMHSGGALAAGVRARLYVLMQREEVDGRHFRLGRQFQAAVVAALPWVADASAQRQLVRTQARLLGYDVDAAIDAIPELLEGASAQEIQTMVPSAEELASVLSEPLGGAERKALSRVLGLFDTAAGKQNDDAGKPRRFSTGAAAPASHPPRRAAASESVAPNRTKHTPNASEHGKNGAVRKPKSVHRSRARNDDKERP